MSIHYPEFVNTKELAHLLAGGDDYIRTKNNIVLGLALTRKLNPDAPEVVVFGKGPRVVARAELFLQSRLVVPAYIKRKVDQWQYLGQYKAVDIRTEASALTYYGRTRIPDTVAGALILERVDVESLSVHGGGFADSETRKAVEEAAIKYAIRYLEKAKFSVEDCQRENRGYDLLARKESSCIYVEVKGTDAAEPRFFLTRNERTFAGRESDWRIFVVCAARTVPCLFQFTRQELEAQFHLEALAWECTKRDA